MEELIGNLMAKEFGVKQNPFVSFWFVLTDKLKNGLKVPEGFSLYKTKIIFGKEWNCFAKKSVKACFSDEYWKEG